MVFKPPTSTPDCKKIQIRLTYSLEWYEHGERHGKAVPDFATVAEEARLKAFEVEALKAG